MFLKYNPQRIGKHYLEQTDFNVLNVSTLYELAKAGGTEREHAGITQLNQLAYLKGCQEDFSTKYYENLPVKTKKTKKNKTLCFPFPHLKEITG